MSILRYSYYMLQITIWKIENKKSQKMKILMLDYLSYGAHKNFNKIHIEALIKSGCSLHLVGGKKQFDNIIKNPAIQIDEIPGFLTPTTKHSPIFLRFVYIICLLWLRCKYNVCKYDVIVIPTYDPMSIWVYRTSKKLVLITHDVHYLENKIKYYAVNSLPAHYIHVGLSVEMVEKMKSLYPHKRIQYIPHGLCPISECDKLVKPQILNNINNEYLFCPINNKYEIDFIHALFTSPILINYLEKNNLILIIKKKLFQDNKSPRIVTIENDLSKPEYDYLIQNALVVILPYEYNYKYRCSGILFECVMRDTPVLATNIQAMSIYKEKINLKLFDSVLSLIDGVNLFRNGRKKVVDKDYFDPYKYWQKTLDEL